MHEFLKGLILSSITGDGPVSFTLVQRYVSYCIIVVLSRTAVKNVLKRKLAINQVRAKLFSHINNRLNNALLLDYFKQWESSQYSK